MIELHLFLSTLTFWHWLILGIGLFIIEVLAGSSGFLLWIGIAAGVTAVVSGLLPSLHWQWQLILFAISAVGSVLLWRRHLRNNPIQSDKPNLNRRSEQYIGRIFTLEEEVFNGRGRVRVDDTVWRISCDVDLSIGAKVKIVGARGVLLLAEKAE